MGFESGQLCEVPVPGMAQQHILHAIMSAKVNVREDCEGSFLAKAVSVCSGSDVEGYWIPRWQRLLGSFCSHFCAQREVSLRVSFLVVGLASEHTGFDGSVRFLDRSVLAVVVLVFGVQWSQGPRFRSVWDYYGSWSWSMGISSAVVPVPKPQACTYHPWSWSPGLCDMPQRLRPWWAGCNGGLVLGYQGTVAASILSIRGTVVP